MVQCGSDVNSDLCYISDTSKHVIKARGQSRDSHQYFLTKCWKTGACTIEYTIHRVDLDSDFDCPVSLGSRGVLGRIA